MPQGEPVYASKRSISQSETINGANLRVDTDDADANSVCGYKSGCPVVFISDAHAERKPPSRIPASSEADSLRRETGPLAGSTVFASASTGVSERSSR